LLRHEEAFEYMLALTEVTQVERILAELRQANIVVEDMQLIEADLEDVFVDLVSQP